MSGQRSRWPSSRSTSSPPAPHESHVHPQGSQCNVHPVPAQFPTSVSQRGAASFVQSGALPPNASLVPSPQPVVIQHPFPAPATQPNPQAVILNSHPQYPPSDAYPQLFVPHYPQYSVPQSWSSQVPPLHPFPQASSPNAYPQFSVLPAAPRLLASPQPWEITASDAIKLGRAWFQPLNGTDIRPAPGTRIVAPFEPSSLFREVKKGLFGRSKGFLDGNRPVVLIEGQTYALICFCGSSDVDYEPKNEVDRVMLDWDNVPELYNPYIHYMCKSCKCKWAMNMPTSEADLRRLQNALRSTETWKAIKLELPESSGPVHVAIRNHHNFTCPTELGGCGRRDIQCESITKDGIAIPFFKYTCKHCGYHWSAREPATPDAWSRWRQWRNESDIHNIGSRPADREEREARFKDRRMGRYSETFPI